MSVSCKDTETQVLPLPRIVVDQMKQTQQNANYHAEGNVFNHTQLVLQEYAALITHTELSEADKEVLYWAAVLHDLGKIKVTRWTGKRWSASGHERAGVPMARNILLQQPQINTRQRRKILDLVRWHHLPLRLGLKHAPLSAYHPIAIQTDIRLLGLFSMMDLRGRKCINMEQIQALILHFNEEVIPFMQNYWGTFENLQARFHQAHPEIQNYIWQSLQVNDFERILHLLNTKTEKAPRKSVCHIPIGLPGSGIRDYLETNLADLPTYAVDLQNTADKLLPDERLTAFISGNIDKQRSMILSGYNVDTAWRQQLVDYMRSFSIKIQYLFFERSLPFLLKQNQLSGDEGAQTHLRKQYELFDWPHPWEAHELVSL